MEEKSKKELLSIGDQQIDKAFQQEKDTGGNLDLRRFESDFDKIQRSYQDPTYKLTDKLQEQLDRWLWAREVREDDPTVRSKRQLAQRIMVKFNVSKSTAYGDINNMERLFLTLDNINADFEKLILLETVKQELHRASELGVKGQKTVPALIKEARELLKEQAEKDKNIEPTIVNIQVVDNPELVGGRRIPGIKEKAAAAINKAKAAAQRRFEEVDFEEIND